MMWDADFFVTDWPRQSRKNGWRQNWWVMRWREKVISGWLQMIKNILWWKRGNESDFLIGMSEYIFKNGTREKFGVLQKDGTHQESCWEYPHASNCKPYREWRVGVLNGLSARKILGADKMMNRRWSCRQVMYGLVRTQLFLICTVCSGS